HPPSRGSALKKRDYVIERSHVAAIALDADARLRPITITGFLDQKRISSWFDAVFEPDLSRRRGRCGRHDERVRERPAEQHRRASRGRCAGNGVEDINL